MEHIGFAGLGRMGQAMAGRLLDAGYPLSVYNRTPERANELLARGATWAATPAELASQANIILTILTDDQAVEQVFTGNQGLLAGAVRGKLLIEMSTIQPATIHALRPQVAAAGASLLDAPVAGTLEPARQGQLMVMVGGAAEDLERARPVLKVLSRRIVHIGPSGAGTTMKLALNLPMAVYWGGLAEALIIAEHAGISRELTLNILLDSPFAPPSLGVKAPLLLGAAHEVAFDVNGVRKDLAVMTAAAQAAGVPGSSAATAQALFAAATAAGYGGQDLVFVVDYLRELVARTRQR